MGETKKVFVKTFGCQMNVYDSERMTEHLGTVGYAETADMTDADLVILNTCHIREKAADKVYSDLGRIRDLKDARKAVGKDTVIAVTGCVAQAEGAEIQARAPYVDLVAGPQSYHRLPDMLARVQGGQSHQLEIAFPEDEKFAHLPARVGGGVARSASAYLTVQEGCDKFCTFCVVPYTRGVEYSRAVDHVIDEAEKLVARGVREITLLGQNVNAYHGTGPNNQSWTLARLIRRLAEIDGIERLRYTTSHPRDMGDDLILAHADVAKLMPYLHLPFQAGADRILAAMNRKHTAADYRALVRRIRDVRPDIALSTDVIVGFPGETESEFQQTLDLIADVGFAQAYTFKYSPRPGTPAAKIDNQVSEAVKSERLVRLQTLLESEHAKFNAGCVGRTVPVLFEKTGRQSGQIIGRSPYLQHVSAVGSADLVGQIRKVAISSASSYSLAGVVTAA
jgi:tRNA-2-methylthio-N6-dimethylallyladenosine synthase